MRNDVDKDVERGGRFLQQGEYAERWAGTLSGQREMVRMNTKTYLASAGSIADDGDPMVQDCVPWPRSGPMWKTGDEGVMDVGRPTTRRD